MERSRKTPHVSPAFVLFTDLDGTLLDAETFRYEPARPALAQLRERAIPVIISTSKTHAEVEPFRKELGNRDPFIVENGGAVYIPLGYFTSPPRGTRSRPGYCVLDMGVSYETVRKGLRRVEADVDAILVGLGDMSLERIVQTTGLRPSDAERARRREYDEPFLIEGRARPPLETIQAAAQRIGLTVLGGGRFLHLAGDIDKGKACRRLIDCYRKEWGAVVTAAIGDSAGDLPMLASVDRPFLVEQPGGGHVSSGSLEGLTRVRGAGPAGWVEAVNILLRTYPAQPASAKDPSLPLLH